MTQGKAQRLMSLVTGTPATEDTGDTGGDTASDTAAYIGELMDARDAAEGAAMHWEGQFRQVAKENNVLALERDEAVEQLERMRVRYLAGDPDAEPAPTRIYDQLATELRFELGVYDEPLTEVAS